MPHNSVTLFAHDGPNLVMPFLPQNVRNPYSDPQQYQYDQSNAPANRGRRSPAIHALAAIAVRNLPGAAPELPQSVAAIALRALPANNLLVQKLPDLAATFDTVAG